MTSSATKIRNAAERLRSLATAAAHEDRTRWMVGHTLGSKSPVVVDNHEKPTVLIESWAQHREQVNDYLAAFGSPMVGLAVAALLEQQADLLEDEPFHDQVAYPGEPRECSEDCHACASEEHALGVARAFSAAFENTNAEGDA
ncbi:hypothetical protein XF35_38955 [Streptomyces platensis subsp. clarensis]|uniref:Uncharacterized protein n=1 Tax=Streptomyces showdoensis TaxID=68268 RepID=A0A2P2GKU4_STREW|nr:hypothetical protein [Streptomyces showdoensis]KKZ72126.1 hypothetical protein VO63_20350 [Streptomyces showdoensis]MCW7991039.1 hypothetical protein [Streptomyces platensis subsp. clarensis]